MLTLREEILNLLESPELLEYLLSNPERLCGFDYANIIAVSPGRYFENRLFAVYGRRALLHIDRGWRRLLRRSVHVSGF